jgi:hypothetical protein
MRINFQIFGVSVEMATSRTWKAPYTAMSLADAHSLGKVNSRYWPELTPKQIRLNRIRRTLCRWFKRPYKHNLPPVVLPVGTLVGGEYAIEDISVLKRHDESWKTGPADETPIAFYQNIMSVLDPADKKEVDAVLKEAKEREIADTVEAFKTKHFPDTAA